MEKRKYARDFEINCCTYIYLLKTFFIHLKSPPLRIEPFPKPTKALTCFLQIKGPNEVRSNIANNIIGTRAWN